MRSGQGNGASHEDLTGKSFLSALPPEAVEAFEAIQVTTRYPAGSVLFVEGETPRGPFVLLSGRVKLSIGSESGKVMILSIARPGEILGLHAVVSHAVFQATAQTIEPCKVSFVRSDELLRFLGEHPQASLEAARQLSSSYQEACGQLRAIGLCDSARQRVARFVLEWVEHGEQDQDGIRATLTLTHEEIGQLIGTSRETITRALGDFKNRGWIFIKGSTLVVKDREAMQQLAGCGSRPPLSYEPSGEEISFAPRPYMDSHNTVLLRENRL